ncbi:MAG: hypothetical protein CMF72_10925 [Mameliella sp.]|nr:hypothetical protein [Mameliella sp.]
MQRNWLPKSGFFAAAQQKGLIEMGLSQILRPPEHNDVLRATYLPPNGIIPSNAAHSLSS